MVEHKVIFEKSDQQNRKLKTVTYIKGKEMLFFLKLQYTTSYNVT